MALVALKGFKHPEDRRKVLAGEDVSLPAKYVNLYRYLNLVGTKPRAATTKRASAKKKAPAKK